MIAKSLFFAAALASANAASAAILIDALPKPTATLVNLANNNSNGPNLLVQFTVSSAVDITGFSIVTQDINIELSYPVLFKLRADVAGKPAGTNIASIADGLDTIEAFRSTNLKLAGVTFAPIRLEAGTYWAGLSNNEPTGAIAMRWAHYNNGDPIKPLDQYSIQRDNANGTVPNIYDLAWQLHGNVVAAPAVPEPATWAMMLAGLGLAGAALRRRTTAVTFA